MIDIDAESFAPLEGIQAKDLKMGALFTKTATVTSSPDIIFMVLGKVADDPDIWYMPINSVNQQVTDVNEFSYVEDYETVYPVYATLTNLRRVK